MTFLERIPAKVLAPAAGPVANPTTRAAAMLSMDAASIQRKTGIRSQCAMSANVPAEQIVVSTIVRMDIVSMFA